MATRVFISYARASDDPDHDEAVRDLWTYLRGNGVDAQLDRPAEEFPQDWPIWMQNQIREAEFVLVIASPAYRLRSEAQVQPTEGRGVQWEAGIIRAELHSDPTLALRKYLPVLLPGRSVDDLPIWLGPTTRTHYDLTEFPAGGTERLLRLLTGQPYEDEPPLGRMPVLPKRGASNPTSDEHGPARSDLSTVGRSEFAEPHLVAPLRRLFLHFFDPHFLDEVSQGRNATLVATETVRATRLAVLAAETVFVPAASYIESILCATTIDAYRPLFEAGQIVLVGGEANIVNYAMTKLLQYEQGGDRFRRYEAVLSSTEITPPFRTRERSATDDIRKAWYESLGNLSPLLAGIPGQQIRNLENRWAEVPARLADRAFTPEYAIPALFAPSPKDGAELIVARRAGSRINSEYFRSYTTELDAGIVTDLTYLYSPRTGTSVMNLPFQPLIQTLTSQGLLGQILGASAEQLIALRGDSRISAAMAQAIETARGVNPARPS